MSMEKVLEKCTGFQWDKGNFLKNWKSHNIRATECEQVFFNRPMLVAPDVKHSKRETRYYTLGKSDAGRRLLLVFTVRGTLIRIISARDMNRKEMKEYDRL